MTVYHWHLLPLDLNGFRLSLKFSSTGAFVLFRDKHENRMSEERKRPMFDSLKGKLQSVFSGLGKRGTLNEGDVNEALREVRLALLDADVALPVVKPSWIISVKKLLGRLS